ncbi:MAG: (d)CMP kinase [Bacteroidia bacterium]|nr:(d)CMP kinase [Bacteroidia bacterium]
MQNKIIIALDGFSSCGKSTLAKAIAKELNYKYIDTGAMYRTVTKYFLDNNIDVNDKEILHNALDNIGIDFEYNTTTDNYDICLNGENIENDIRKLEIARKVSEVSTLPEVRESLVQYQQEMGEKKGLVMDGRDIGTVVFPNAELKIFLTADPEVRAQRRFKELEEKGENISIEEIRYNLTHRDELDTTREISPLKKADDAIEIDNTYLNEQESLEFALNLVAKVIV